MKKAKQVSLSLSALDVVAIGIEKAQNDTRYLELLSRASLNPKKYYPSNKIANVQKTDYFCPYF
jgi:hypothetical protein